MSIDQLIRNAEDQIKHANKHIQTKQRQIEHLKGLKKKDGWHLVSRQRGKEGDLYAENLFFLVRDGIKVPTKFNEALAFISGLTEYVDYILINKDMTNIVTNEDECHADEVGE